MLFSAVIVSAALYGAGCLQAWLYFRTYLKRDSRWIKALVAWVIVCDHNLWFVYISHIPTKGYPPENAETPGNSVGGSAEPLNHFLEKVSRHLKNVFARVEKNLFFYG
ncbi:hypothetical protein B0H14DRAFT_2908096 [Mycena olivaceomarginata]|nr:hypothetical protein B0H14DRAFT_2908096 [Mycena olivaceomarginata]